MTAPFPAEFTLLPAKRRAVPALVGITGQSGSGKTYSALLLAKGIAPDGKIAVIDTEGGRALQYAGWQDMPAFFHLDLRPPFSSLRFRDAIKACEAQGAQVIVIDSASHEHEGEGGLLDFADQEALRMDGKFANRNKWIRPKADHQKFMNALRGSRAWVIACIREKRIIDMESKPAREILVPVCAADFLFEMTLHIRLEPTHDHVPAGERDRSHTATYHKVPAPLRSAVRDGELITVEHGRLLHAAVNEGTEPAETATDTEREALLQNAEEKAREGTAAYRAWLEGLPKEFWPVIKVHRERLTGIAKAADAAQPLEDQGNANT